VRNTLFPWTEKAPAIAGRGQLAERIDVGIWPLPAPHNAGPNAS
jgi:hypothetical protein